jgi:hypothetical protein
MHPDLVPTLAFRAGRARVRGWPTHLPPPFGMVARGSHLEGPARLRWRLRRALEHTDMQYVDLGAPTEQPALPPPDAGPTIEQGAPGALASLRAAGYRAMLVGLADDARIALVAALVRTLVQRALVLVVDSGAEHRWRQALADAGFDRACDVHGIAHAARSMPWLGAQHDLLVVDAPELMPTNMLRQALDESAALARVGLAARADWRRLADWANGLGPVVAIADDTGQPRCHERRVPMPDDVAARYALAWSTFLGAFDRFAAVQPGVGFGTFVQQARQDPAQRPALFAWHEALRLAAWHDNKAAVVAELLQQHGRDRVLVFTPDRRTAYALANAHLLPAVTAELPRAERAHLFDAFAAGSLRTLAGPRLLDLGVAERTADVAILIGNGFGPDQRRARCRRVALTGIVYELVSLDTVEVGRAHRWRGSAADATAVVHDR